MYTRGKHSVAGVGDKDQQADEGDEGAHLCESSGLVNVLIRVKHIGSSIISLRFV